MFQVRKRDRMQVVRMQNRLTNTLSSVPISLNTMETDLEVMLGNRPSGQQRGSRVNGLIRRA